MGRNALEEIRFIRNKYWSKWLDIPEECDPIDDLIVNLLNELEDLYNPNRLNGN